MAVLDGVGPLGTSVPGVVPVLRSIVVVTVAAVFRGRRDVGASFGALAVVPVPGSAGERAVWGRQTGCSSTALLWKKSWTSCSRLWQLGSERD